MANTAISALTAATSIAGADLVPVVQGGTTKKTAASLIRQGGPSPHYFVSGRYYTQPGTIGSLAASSGYIYYQPFDIPNDVTINEMVVNCTTLGAGSSARLGIYSNVAGVPGTLLVEPTSTTQLDTTSTGIKTATLSQALTAGTWWLAFLIQNNTAAVFSGLAISPSALIGSTTAVGCLANSLTGYNNTGANTSGALPSTADALANLTQATVVPRIAVKTA